MGDAERREFEIVVNRMARLIFELSTGHICARLDLLDLNAALRQAKRRRPTRAQEIADAAIARARQRGIA